MRMLDLVKLSTRMFRTRPLRTMLTILSVSVGIGTIVFLVSLGYGLQTILIEKITTSESLLSLDIFPPESEGIWITSDVLDKFRSLPNVSEVAGIKLIPTQVTFGESITNATGNDADPSFFRLSGIRVLVGAFYGIDDTEHVVISSTLAQLFEWKPEEAVGKKIKLTADETATTTAVAIAPAKDQAVSDTYNEQHKEVIISGVVQNDSPLVYFSPKLLSVQESKYSQAKVRVHNADVMESVRSEILDKGFVVSALSDVVDQANKIFKVLQVILAVFGAAALLVSAIGMFNTMTIAFLERTQEIGIMRALGASRNDMFAIFLAESSVMGFLGGFMGIIIGYTGEVIINFGINLFARSLGGTTITLFRTPLWLIVSIVLFSTFVGFLTGVFPGRRASKLNPLEALQYK